MILLLSLATASDIDRVPQDFPTLQAAVEQGVAERIVLGPGRWAGARIDRVVHIQGAPGAIIDTGVRAGPLQSGLWLTDGASGSMVEQLIVDCDGQVDAALYSSARHGGLAQRIDVAGLTMKNCTQGITVAGPRFKVADASWSIMENHVEGTRPESLTGGRGGGIGVMLYNVRGVDVLENAFVGWSDDAGEYVSAGVVLSGCEQCSVVGNRFATQGFQWGHASIVDAGRTVNGGLSSVDLVLADNDARDGGAWRGVDFRLHGTRGALVDGNGGDLWSDVAVD